MSANSFDDAKLVEAKSLALLEPFLRETKGHFVLTNKGNTARFLQETVGDLLYNDHEGELWSVECKAERKWTGNLFLELWSNRNLDDHRNYSYAGSKPGWLYTNRADLLFYHFLDRDMLVSCSMFALKRWSFVRASKHMSTAFNGVKSELPGRIFDFSERVQRQREQLNDTRGRLVPVMILQNEMESPPKIQSVTQLTLDIFGETGAADNTWSEKSHG